MKTSLQIGYTEMQDEMARLAEQFCTANSSMDKVRALFDSDTGYDEAVWAELAGLGLCGVPISEAYGGSGLGLAELVPVVEQMGRRLVAGPYVDTMLAALLIERLGSEGQKINWLPAICAGRNFALAFEDAGEGQPVCLGSWKGDRLVVRGDKCLVAFADSVDFILVKCVVDGAEALVVLERQTLPSTALRHERVIDETQRSYSLKLDQIVVPETSVLTSADMDGCLHESYLSANLLNAALMVGGCKSALDLTIDYANTRTQFGRPIGSYQAVKHTLVDVWIGYEKARSLLYAAASEWNSPSREKSVRMARIKAETAFAFAADRAIQYHGALGFTHDCDAGLYRRRALFCAARYDNALTQKHRLAALLFAG